MTMGMWMKGWGGGISATVLLLSGCEGEGGPSQVECTESGTICTVAGVGQASFSGDGGPAYAAGLYWPMDVAPEPGTSRYAITDWNNHHVRLVDENGDITSIVGTDLPGDGPADLSDREEPGADGTAVALNHPVQVEWDEATGMLYLPNWHNHKVRTWDPATGKVLVVVADTGPDDGNGANAGFAGDEGPAEDALLFFPNSLAFDPSGNFYILDQKNLVVRQVDTNWTIHTVAGQQNILGSSSDGTAAGTQFAWVDALTNPQPEPGGAIESDDTGWVYIADTWNHRICRFDPSTSAVEIIAGTGTAGYSGDGGQAIDATLNSPRDLEIGPDGFLYVADTDNHAVRAIDLTTGAIETVAGTGQAGTGEEQVDALQSALNRPFGIDFDADGALMIADTWNHRVRRVTP